MNREIEYARRARVRNLHTLKPPPRQRFQQDNRRKPAGVYFLMSDWHEFIKIGFSSRPGERVYRSQLWGPHTLLAVLPGVQQDERDIHARFADLRVHGEWYRCEGPLAEYVAWVGQTFPLRTAGRGT